MDERDVTAKKAQLFDDLLEDLESVNGSQMFYAGDLRDKLKEALGKS